MSDAASVNTKSTFRSNATGVSRASSAKSFKSSRRSNMSKADWRVVVRDGFAALFDMVGDWAYLYAIFHRDYDVSLHALVIKGTMCHAHVSFCSFWLFNTKFILLHIIYVLCRVTGMQIHISLANSLTMKQ